MFLALQVCTPPPSFRNPPLTFDVLDSKLFHVFDIFDSNISAQKLQDCAK